MAIIQHLKVSCDKGFLIPFGAADNGAETSSSVVILIRQLSPACDEQSGSLKILGSADYLYFSLKYKLVNRFWHFVEPTV